MPTMTYLQAISDAMREEMRADERVFVMGEDIGVFGGAFKVTDGFIEEFGAKRVMDTPLAESGIIGTAVGASVVGLRPVCEMQLSDFISCGFDQLVNVAGKMHYRQGLAVPITVRLPSGGACRPPHWLWFFIPHTTIAYILFRHRDRFERSAVRMYAVFDLGVSVFFFLSPPPARPVPAPRPP